MACGTPVVASQVGGLAILVQDGQTGFAVPNGDVPALSDRLTRLLTDPALRETLGRQAAAYARLYSWENIVDRLLDVYEGILTPNRLPVGG
jgi:D-inositol-3-phosphate glycosyltransferase